jgi:spermidine synthase
MVGNIRTQACNQCLTSGKLHVHIGDALNLCNITIPGGFAGLIVDLFAGGAVIPALQQIETWQQLGEKLSPGGKRFFIFQHKEMDAVV